VRERERYLGNATERRLLFPNNEEIVDRQTVITFCQERKVGNRYNFTGEERTTELSQGTIPDENLGQL
jgi:hypothetical protein